MRANRYRINSFRAVVLGMILLWSMSAVPAMAQRGRTDAGQRVERKASTKVSKQSTDRSAKRATNGNRSDRATRPSAGTRSDRATRPSVNQRSDRRVENRGNRSNRVERRAPERIYIPSKRVNRYRPVVRYDNRIRVSHPRIHVNIAWPWQIRYQRHWAPRYRYRQVVIVHTGSGRSARSEQVEMETTYRHRVVFADDRKAVLAIEIENVAVYSDGRFVGSVDHIPASLARLEATVYRDGEITFDRDVFLVGDRRAGFEMISTRFYDDNVMSGYRANDGYRVGRVDFRRDRVNLTNRSRLFDPYSSYGHIPISLLPENEGWLWDFGADAISAASDDYDGYYGGAWSPRAGIADRSASFETSYTAPNGLDVRLSRESRIQRVE